MSQKIIPKIIFTKIKLQKFQFGRNRLFGFGFVRIDGILSDSMKVYGIFMFGYFKYYFFSCEIIDFIFIFAIIIIIFILLKKPDMK